MPESPLTYKHKHSRSKVWSKHLSFACAGKEGFDSKMSAVDLKIQAVAALNHQPTLKQSLLAATALC